LTQTLVGCPMTVSQRYPDGQSALSHVRLQIPAELIELAVTQTPSAHRGCGTAFDWPDDDCPEKEYSVQLPPIVVGVTVESVEQVNAPLVTSIVRLPTHSDSPVQVKLPVWPSAPTHTWQREDDVVENPVTSLWYTSTATACPSVV
jgi:hypothetical protein